LAGGDPSRVWLRRRCQAERRENRLRKRSYNALILAREICHSYGIVCTTNGHSQMSIATMLGSRFSVIDIAGVHNVYYRELIYRYGLRDFCASIPNIRLRLPRPGIENAP
jgi:hypothetical protein